MFVIKTNGAYFKRENRKYENMIDFAFDVKSAKQFNELDEVNDIVNKLHNLGYEDVEIIWMS